MALEAIANAYREGGIGQQRSQTNVRCVSIEQVSKIKEIIEEKKGLSANIDIGLSLTGFLICLTHHF